MRKQDVRQLLYEGLTASLAPSGFRLRTRDERLVRTVPEGQQSLSVALVQASPGFECTVTLALRLTAVEELVNRILETPPQYAGITLTTLTQLEHFGLEPKPGRGVWFPIASPEDGAAVVEELRALVETQLLPFFARYYDLLSVAAGIEADWAPAPAASPAEARTPLARLLRPFQQPAPAPAAEDPWAAWTRERRLFNQTLQPHRALKNVAVAHLAGSPHVAAMVESYRHELAPFIESERQKLEELVLALQRSREA